MKVKIVDRANSDAKLRVKDIEARFPHIDMRKPSLNVQVNTQTEFRLNVKIVRSKMSYSTQNLLIKF